ncbi:integrase catalytic domain-containing protein [Trichonephila clavipes]|nr:integrase catalytic domain-containing protein [Trichonephila clavipes]
MGTLYKEFLSEYKRLSHIEEIKNEELDKIDYYISHHSVYKSEKASTPLRVVFDASAKTTRGFSLNSILLNGGIIQQDLFSIVSRFRKHECIILPATIRIEIHGFSDASESAYAAVVYIKCFNESGQSQTRLLCSKSRVAPLKTLTIPRFINKIKAKESCNTDKYLTADEIKRSTEFLAEIAQLSEFKAEIDVLKKGKGVSKTSKLKALDPFLSENSLLRVGGRLSNADLPFEAKHQIINRWVFLYDKLFDIRQALTDITDFNICVRQPRYIKEDCISQNSAM